jgi:nucleoside-diphosphate-sugar epimerase
MNWQGKSVLITGGAGFIGSHLTNRLHRLGAGVIVVDDLSTGDKNKVEAACNAFIEGDVSQSSTYKKIKRFDVDYIFHFGSPSSVVLFNKKPDDCIYKTIFGFRRILELAEEKEVTKLIYPSSGSVYGDAPVPQTEDMLPKPTNLYGVCKLTCEQLAKLSLDKVPSVGLRIFAGYGPGEEAKGEIASVITLFAKAILKGGRPVIYGNGQQDRDFVFIEDILAATLKAAETDYTGVVNVGSGESYSFNKLVDVTNKLVDVTNKLLRKNTKPLYVNKPMRYLERTLASREVQDKVLGFRPTALEVGIGKLLDYLKEKDSLKQ